MAKYKHKARVDLYEKEPEPQNPWPFIIIGGLVLLVIIGSCSG